MSQNSASMHTNVAKKKQVVLCITNVVVMNFTANVLLALGFSPIMSVEKSDAIDLVEIADAILINAGTPDENFLQISKSVIEQGISRQLPIVFDPVGCGASKLRNIICKEILEINYDQLIIKGNASEILSLATLAGCVDSASISAGVDSLHNSEQALIASKAISKKYNKIICITGENDYVVSGMQVIKIKNGCKEMSQLTGTGCALGAVLAGFLASREIFLYHERRAQGEQALHQNEEILAKGIRFFSICGEIAKKQIAKLELGIGSFSVFFLDALYGARENKSIETEMKLQFYEFQEFN